MIRSVYVIVLLISISLRREVVCKDEQPIPAYTVSTNQTKSLHSLLKCALCQSQELHGQIADCKTQYHTVNIAARNFYVPRLKELTERVFFSHFRVDLDRPCPFWSEDGQCAYEACSVGICDPHEVPSAWLDSTTYGNDSTPDCEGQKKSKVLDSVDRNSHSKSRYVAFLETFQSAAREVDWTDMPENNDFSPGSFVNLLKNPERYTGYSGPSAGRVWKSITEDNCFGGEDDKLFEKRVFYRIMSGLRASISTHIARDFYDKDSQTWGKNIPLYIRSVGAHPDRLNNMYFTFLFLLRALTRSSDLLLRYDYSTGNHTEDILTKQLMQRLLKPELTASKSAMGIPLNLNGDGSLLTDSDGVLKMVEECRYGFDESSLFVEEVGGYREQIKNWHEMAEKEQLLEDFRGKFRNITRIMDCVTCEKCRLWGKLQILGIGTAAKILLSKDVSTEDLTRQEVIALINVVHQIGKSILFAEESTEVEFQSKLNEAGMAFTAAVIATSLLTWLCFGRKPSRK